MPSLYTFSEYSADWPLEFEREAARLRGYFKDEIIAIHHIGSTSVPGLAAKPIIDLLPVIRTIRNSRSSDPAVGKGWVQSLG